MKTGTAPASITVLVCMEVPDAMLVSAHAASNYRGVTDDHVECILARKKERKTERLRERETDRAREKQRQTGEGRGRVRKRDKEVA